MKHLVIAALTLMLSFTAFAAPWSQWRSVGNATLNWGPFEVYHSTLLTPDGKYQARTWPQALAIRYLRSIDRQALVNVTEEQWRALGLLNQAQKNGWLEVLQKTWPDVSHGSEIIFLADEQGGRFYNGLPNSAIFNAIGAPFSPSFRDAFLAIWLSPAAHYPDLRSKLMGASAPD